MIDRKVVLINLLSVIFFFLILWIFNFKIAAFILASILSIFLIIAIKNKFIIDKYLKYIYPLTYKSITLKESTFSNKYKRSFIIKTIGVVFFLLFVGFTSSYQCTKLNFTSIIYIILIVLVLHFLTDIISKRLVLKSSNFYEYESKIKILQTIEIPLVIIILAAILISKII